MDYALLAQASEAVADWGAWLKMIGGFLLSASAGLSVVAIATAAGNRAVAAKLWRRFPPFALPKVGGFIAVITLFALWGVAFALQHFTGAEFIAAFFPNGINDASTEIGMTFFGPVAVYEIGKGIKAKREADPAPLQNRPIR